MIPKDSVDVAIIIPKEDEFRALEWAFGTQFKQSSGKLIGGKPYFRFKHKLFTSEGTGEISIAVVLINDQGNSIASSVTEQVFTHLNPILIFLIGTAAGREGKVKIGDVVVSELVFDIQEWKIEKKETPRSKQHIPSDRILYDVSRFIGKDSSTKGWLEKLQSAPKGLYSNKIIPKKFWSERPDVHLKLVASGNSLQLNPDKLKLVWDLDDRIRCYEMEGAGFAMVCKQYKAPWLVIRGISDYGYLESKKEEHRVAASLAVATFLRMFIEHGLIECFPYSIRVPESEKSELSDKNFYTHFDILTALKMGIKDKLGFDLSGVDFGRSLSLADFEAICVSQGANIKDSRDVLSEIRETYFTKKYLDYTYQNDLRGLIPGWATEVRDIISSFSIDIGSCTILDVGIGNGLEAPYLFPNFKKFIGLDVSKAMLKQAKKIFPALEIIHNSAEDMDAIETASVDMYISLRTYQSSLFDMNLAIREGNRVLRHRGVFIVSIANGFVDIENSKRQVIRGLLIPGTRRVVDKSAPRKLADRVIEKLTDLGFESIGYSLLKTDIYVWGQKQ